MISINVYCVVMGFSLLGNLMIRANFHIIAVFMLSFSVTFSRFKTVIL